MAKVMVINGVWASLVCGMLACSIFLYDQKAITVEPFGNQIASAAQ